MPAHRKVTLEQEPQIIEWYKNGDSLHTIADKLGIKWYPIYNVLRRNNIERRSTFEFSRKYEVDETYWEKIDSHEKAYFLGLMMADGAINDDPMSMGFRINLQEDDRELIDRFKISLKSEQPLSYVKSRVDKKHGWTSKPQVEIRVHSKKMAEDLIKLGCAARKSLTLEWPKNLPEEFINSSVLGYFDGDGCVSCSLKQKKWVGYCADIVSSIKFIEDASKIIKNKLNITFSISIRRGGLGDNYYSRLSIASYDNIIKFMDWIYKDVPYLALKRKYDRFQQMKYQKGIVFEKYK